MPYFYWRHKKTGDIYAVRITADGVLDGAAGPIPPKEATFARLPHWQFDTEQAQQLRWRMLEFEKTPGEETGRKGRGRGGGAPFPARSLKRNGHGDKSVRK